MTKHLGFFLNILAICLFVPGIILPMFSLSMEVTANLGASNLTSELINKELSLLATIDELWQDKRVLVASLIFVFSIIIPVTKCLLVVWAYFSRHFIVEKKLIDFVGAIGKWSMADVFIVAVFLAVLSTNHADTINKEQIQILGFKIDLLISSETLSFVGEGFYYFTAYCLVALLGTQFSSMSVKQRNNQLDQNN